MSTNVSNTIALLLDLVKRDSVTPADQGCQELIAARLKPLGFELENMPANGVSNLWYSRATQM